MAANTFGSPVVFHNKTYPSASAALDEYISNYDSSRQLIRRRYDQEVQNLFLSSPNAKSTLESSQNPTGAGGAAAAQRALMDSGVTLTRVALSNTSTLPSAENSDLLLNRLRSISSMTTDELLAQKPVVKLPGMPALSPSKSSVTTDQLLGTHRLGSPGKAARPSDSRSTVRTESVVNAAPAGVLLGDPRSVTTEYLLDVAKSGAERALQALTPSPGKGQQYLTEQQLSAIRQRIEEQLHFAENLRASIQHIEDSRSSGSSGPVSSSVRFAKSAEAEDVLHSRLCDTRRQFYDTIGRSAPQASSLPESLASSGGVNAPSWVRELEEQSDTSSIISGNLLDQRRRVTAERAAKMASTPSRGRVPQRTQIRFDGTASTIRPNDSQRSRGLPPSHAGASVRSKSAAGRLIKDRRDVYSRDVGIIKDRQEVVYSRDPGMSRDRQDGGHGRGYSASMSGSSSRSSGTGSSARRSGGSGSGASGSVATSQGQPIIGRAFQDVENEKHREFILSLQRDIQESRSSIAASTLADDNLMDSIPHALRGKDAGPAASDGRGAGKDDDYLVRIRHLMSTPPAMEAAPRVAGVEKSPDTDVILSGDRSWEKPAGPAQPSSAQPCSMETLKHMLFSLQSFSGPGEEAGSSPRPAPGEQSTMLDDSTAELLRKTSALTSDMENKLAPLMSKISSSGSS